MRGNKDKFFNLKKQKGKVTFGDNASCHILGKGLVNLGKDKAKNVLLVGNMKPILLSVSQTCHQAHICDAGASLTQSSEPTRGGKRTAGKRQHLNVKPF
jgi:hypothetical protein